ncbi:Protein EPIDERMAL PATTERNING FACTOR 1 [Stylosanthes scabra]|uniref:Epidermal patterning factor-like protein n=1 Tax=Stylosanthes scabra TaxID=79078 RepID=A0ABU6QAM7_9FABA|nr:Protein EPIDERMAL PATTERNING FACTOR 1 [Stylosanthes scabra]
MDRLRSLGGGLSYANVAETKDERGIIGKESFFHHKEGRLPETMLVAGSKLPDCSHACGSCSPCRLAMVTSCAPITEAEPCPLAYKCMCHDKSYPVP